MSLFLVGKVVDSATEILFSVYLRMFSKRFTLRENKFVQHVRKYIRHLRGWHPFGTWRPHWTSIIIMRVAGVRYSDNEINGSIVCERNEECSSGNIHTLLVCMYVCMYKVVQIWPGQTVTCLHTNRPGHIWTTLYVCKYVCMFHRHRLGTRTHSCREMFASVHRSRMHAESWHSLSSFFKWHFIGLLLWRSAECRYWNLGRMRTVACKCLTVSTQHFFLRKLMTQNACSQSFELPYAVGIFLTEVGWRWKFEVGSQKSCYIFLSVTAFFRVSLFFNRPFVSAPEPN